MVDLIKKYWWILVLLIIVVSSGVLSQSFLGTNDFSITANTCDSSFYNSYDGDGIDNCYTTGRYNDIGDFNIMTRAVVDDDDWLEYKIYVNNDLKVHKVVEGSGAESVHNEVFMLNSEELGFYITDIRFTSSVWDRGGVVDAKVGIVSASYVQSGGGGAFPTDDDEEVEPLNLLSFGSVSSHIENFTKSIFEGNFVKNGFDDFEEGFNSFFEKLLGWFA